MIRNGFLAAVIAAGFLIPAANTNAQTAIQVEESTGSQVSAPAGSPINIAIPRTRPSDIHLTTATDEPSTEPEVDESGSIDLTPAQFRARRAQDLPVATPAPMVTPKPVTDMTTQSRQADSPGGIPAPTNNPVSESATELDNNDSRTTETETPPEEADEVNTQPVSADGDAESGVDEAAINFLPAANLGNEPTIQRGDYKVAMLPEQLSSAPLNLTVPDVYQTTLTNGMHFYHYESHDLPRVRLNLVIDAGSNAEASDKVGLAELTAQTLRSGGAAGKSGDEIDEALDQIGSDLTINADRDHVEVSVFSLADRSTEAAKLLSDMLMKPELDQKRFEQQKARALEHLRRQNDSPGDISRREFRKLIYGPEHALGRTPTSATLESISLDDVRNFYEQHYRPSSIWIGVSGDIPRDDARKMVESAFEGWDRPAAERVPVPEGINDTATSPGVYLTKKATAQSQIRLGHLGLERRSPKAYAINVLNSVYGMGGFSSRLMNVVRTKHGYVYGVGGGVLSDDPTGMFLAVAASKSATTIAAIKAMIGVTEGIVNDGISDEELTTAKRDVVFNFVSQFDTPQSVIKTHMLHDFRGYAPDYLKTFTDRIQAVTKDEVAEVAKEFMHPDDLVIYVVGNPETMDGPLDEFGIVHEWNLQEYTGKAGK